MSGNNTNNNNNNGKGTAFNVLNSLHQQQQQQHQQQVNPLLFKQMNQSAFHSAFTATLRTPSQPHFNLLQSLSHLQHPMKSTAAYMNLEYLASTLSSSASSSVDTSTATKANNKTSINNNNNNNSKFKSQTAQNQRNNNVILKQQQQQQQQEEDSHVVDTSRVKQQPEMMMPLFKLEENVAADSDELILEKALIYE